MVRLLKLVSCALALGLAIAACGGGSGGGDDTTRSTDDKLTIVGASS